MRRMAGSGSPNQHHRRRRLRPRTTRTATGSLTEFGWTWVSTWNWGWAPFHYGRWVVIAGLRLVLDAGHDVGARVGVVALGRRLRRLGADAAAGRASSSATLAGARDGGSWPRTGSARPAGLRSATARFRAYGGGPASCRTIGAHRGSWTVRVNAGPRAMSRAAPVRLASVAPRQLAAGEDPPAAGASLGMRPWTRGPFNDPPARRVPAGAAAAFAIAAAPGWVTSPVGASKPPLRARPMSGPMPSQLQDRCRYVRRRAIAVPSRRRRRAFQASHGAPRCRRTWPHSTAAAAAAPAPPPTPAQLVRARPGRPHFTRRSRASGPRRPDVPGRPGLRACAAPRRFRRRRRGSSGPRRLQHRRASTAPSASSAQRHEHAPALPASRRPRVPRPDARAAAPAASPVRWRRAAPRMGGPASTGGARPRMGAGGPSFGGGAAGGAPGSALGCSAASAARTGGLARRSA